MFQKSMSLYLEQNCRRELDFQIVFDNTQYWLVNCYFYRQQKKCKKLSKYPDNCSHFVKKIHYGVDLKIYFSQNKFPKTNEVVRFITYY